MFNEKTRQIIKNNAICLMLFIPSLNYYLSEIMVRVFNAPSLTIFAYILLYAIVGMFLLLLFVRHKIYLLAYLFIVLFVLINILLFGNFDYAFSAWYDLPHNRFYILVFNCLPFLFIHPAINF